MSSIALQKEFLMNKISNQTYLLSCIDEEIREFERERNLNDADEYLTLFELIQYRSRLLANIEKSENELKKFDEKINKLVLKHTGFKKGGQLW